MYISLFLCLHLNNIATADSLLHGVNDVIGYHPITAEGEASPIPLKDSYISLTFISSQILSGERI